MWKFLTRLIDTKDRASVKRFLGLLMAFYLILSSTVALFVKVSIANSEIVKDSQLYAFLVICVTLLGMSISDVAFIVLQKAKAQAAAQILTPQPTVTNVDTVQGDITKTKSTTKETTEVGDDILDDNGEEDLKAIKKSLTKNLKEDIE